MDLPTVTAAAVIDQLLEQQLLSVTDLTELFGAQRASIGLNELEMGLVNSGTISNPVLLTVKAAVSGRAPMPERGSQVRPDLLPRSVAKGAGALAIDGRSRPAVAFVEDLPENVAAVADAVGRDDFELLLLTAPQFQVLFEEAYGALSETDRRARTKDVFEIFDEAVIRQASDIHLSAGHPPILRVAGRLTPLNRRPLTNGWLLEQMRVLCGDAVMDAWEGSSDADAGISYGDARFRINLGRDDSGIVVAARRLPVAIPTLDDLRIPVAIRNLCTLERGLVLVTGPTGSGKSTTLAAMLSYITSGAGKIGGRHIITLEDPVEYRLPQGNSLVHQRELGRDFENFPQALRQALRQDPDVILVGEMRDLETTRTAITAAETGHLVLSTLHTFDAVSTIGRLVSQFPEGEQPQIRAQLSYVLKGVVSQALVPTANGQGRIAAFEVLLGSTAVSNNLRKVDGMASLRQVLETSSREGMQTMEMSLAELVRAGTVTRVEAEYRARNVEELRARLSTSTAVTELT